MRCLSCSGILQNIAVGEDFLELFGEQLGCMSSLQRLSIKQCEVNPFVSSLSQGCSVLPNLQELELKDCYYTMGGEQLRTVLQRMTGLTSLVMQCAKPVFDIPSSMSGKALADSVAAMPHLQVLKVTDICVGREGGRALRAAVETCFGPDWEPQEGVELCING